MNNKGYYALTKSYSYYFRVKDPISALTHFIGFIAAIMGMPLLLLYASQKRFDICALASLSIFMLSMIFLYGASTAYHAFNISEHVNLILKKIDHMMIFVLLAGSYTPVCVIALANSVGIKLLMGVWSMAILGILFKAFWVTCPKWVSSIIYIGMGWFCLFAIKDIYYGLSASAFCWLLAGGIVYTIGGVIYALKLPIFQKYFRNFGAHELFHIFVMGGSFCHYIAMFVCVSHYS